MLENEKQRIPKHVSKTRKFKFTNGKAKRIPKGSRQLPAA